MSPDLDPMEIAEIAEALDAAPTPTRTAEDIIGYLRQQLDADHGGITLIGSRGLLETIAATDPLVEQADKWQYELQEGPSPDNSWHQQTLIVSDLTADNRWPRWAEKVTTLGAFSVLATEISTAEDRRIGTINLYWSEPRTFTSDEIAFVNIFARHAALAVSRSLNDEGLHMAMDGRKRIGQAQGILMERFDLDEDRAFEVLRRYSQDHNVKLRQVADDLVATRKLPTSRGINKSREGTETSG